MTKSSKVYLRCKCPYQLYPIHLDRQDAHTYLSRCLNEDSKHPFQGLIVNEVVIRAKESLIHCITHDLKPLIAEKDHEAAKLSAERLRSSGNGASSLGDEEEELKQPLLAGVAESGDAKNQSSDNGGATVHKRNLGSQNTL